MSGEDVDGGEKFGFEIINYKLNNGKRLNMAFSDELRINSINLRKNRL